LGGVRRALVDRSAAGLERLTERARERFAGAGYAVSEPTEEVPPPQPPHSQIWFVDEAGVSREVLVRPDGGYMVFDADSGKSETIGGLASAGRVAGRRYGFVVAWPAPAESVEMNETAVSRQPPRLSDFLPKERWWMMYLNALDHQQAMLLSPDDPG